MSLGQLTSQSSFDDVASAIIGEAIQRGYNRGETIAVTSTGIQESSLRPDAVSPNGKWKNIYQQDASYPNRDDPNEAIREFFNRLDVKRRSPGASPDIWLNIFWLQQRPGEPSADAAYRNGRKAYLTEIQRHTAQAGALYDRFAGGTPVGVSGDPVWLEDVLRPALGDRLRTLPGWQDSGVGGTMGRIWGMIWHHTGNAAATAQSIRDGRPDLAGPLAQLHIAQDGTVTIVAVGPCNHAGRGSWNGLPTDAANELTIGIECAWPRDTTITEETQGRERWPDAQIIAMRDTAAALSLHLGVDASHNISHSEWARFGPAGHRQGKWDPGNLDMGWFRGEVGKAMRGEFKPTPPPTSPGPVPPPVLPAPVNPRTDRQLLEEIWDQQRGPGGRGWPQLEDRTPVDSLAELHRKVDVLLVAEPAPSQPAPVDPAPVAWKPWQLDEPPMRGPEVGKIQHRLLHAFPAASQAEALGVRETSVYDAATAQAVTNFQAHPDVNLPATGIADWATKKRLGVINPTPPPPPAKRFRQQGVGYPAMGFLQPDPNMSYVESRDAGVAEMLRLALPDPGPKVPIGYSQGADVVVRFLHAWPAERRDEIRTVVTFGSPGKPPGPTLLGNNPPGAGISGVYTPEWARDRTYDFTIDGDMYPNAVGLLPELYDLLTRMEVSLEFATYLLSKLTSVAGPALLGLATAGASSVVPGFGALAPILGMVTAGAGLTTSKSFLDPFALMFRLPEIIQTLAAALKFVTTQAHSHYHDQPLFGGLTAVDRAAQIITDGVDSAAVYTVAGTWAGWNDGPPAWTAHQLP